MLGACGQAMFLGTIRWRRRSGVEVAHSLRIDRLCHQTAGLVVGSRCIAPRAYVADGLVSRFVGMLGTPDLALDEALILVPCASVHGIGLRCPIGVAFVTRAGVVLRVVDPLPWWGARVNGAHAVIEARTGVLAALCPGDTVEMDDERLFPLRGNSAP